jgi:hypothetical protein
MDNGVDLLRYRHLYLIAMCQTDNLGGRCRTLNDLAQRFRRVDR